MLLNEKQEFVNAALGALYNCISSIVLMADLICDWYYLITVILFSQRPDAVAAVTKYMPEAVFMLISLAVLVSPVAVVIICPVALNTV